MPDTLNMRRGRPIKDLTGKTFARLTALSLVGRDKIGNATWLCRCECGGEKVIASRALTTGNTMSCGCLASVKASARGKNRYRKKKGHLYATNWLMD